MSRFQSICIYAMGFFSLSLQPMFSLALPLWVLSLGASPMIVGLTVSFGAVLPAFFSVTAGSIIDRVGSRKVIWTSSLILVVVSLLFPVLPFVFAVLIIQFFLGIIISMNWISAQSYVAKLNREGFSNQLASRFSFSANLGTFLGPLIIGAVWDYVEPRLAFVMIALWSVLMWLSAYFSPEEAIKERQGEEQKDKYFFLPRWSYYRRAIMLLAIPAVCIVIFGTFLRLSSVAIRSSFYLVYLEQIHFSAFMIASLFSAWSLISAFSSLSVSYLTQKIREESLLFISLFTCLLPLAISPMFTAYSHHFIITLISGFGLGMTLPLLISILGRAVNPKEQGLAVGLRATSNYTSVLTVPVFFGFVVQGIGLNASFYIVGFTLIGSIVIFAPLLIRWRDRDTTAKGEAS